MSLPELYPPEAVLSATPELKPCVRISASYPATDGSMPETVEIVWETNFPDVHTICSIVDQLCLSATFRPQVREKRNPFGEPQKIHINQPPT